MNIPIGVKTRSFVRFDTANYNYNVSHTQKKSTHKKLNKCHLLLNIYFFLLFICLYFKMLQKHVL